MKFKIGQEVRYNSESNFLFYEGETLTIKNRRIQSKEYLVWDGIYISQWVDENELTEQ